MKTTIFFLLFFFFISPILTSCSQGAKIENTAQPIAQVAKPRTGKGRLVVLDPGHGGFDKGAYIGSFQEKILTLKTASLVKKYLNEIGYRAILTRTQDIFIPLEKRATIANDTGCKLFVSIHYNAHKDTTINGIEVFFYNKGLKARAEASRKLAGKVLTKLIEKTGAGSRGVKQGNYHVIRETKMPAILIEGGFITNPKEREWLSRKTTLNTIALSIAEGIDNYLNSK